MPYTPRGRAAQCCCCRARCQRHAVSNASPWLPSPCLRCLCAWAGGLTAPGAGTRCQQPPARRWCHSPAGSKAGPNSTQAAAAGTRCAQARPGWGANPRGAAAAGRTGACARGQAPGPRQVGAHQQQQQAAVVPVQAQAQGLRHDEHQQSSDHTAAKGPTQPARQPQLAGAAQAWGAQRREQGSAQPTSQPRHQDRPGQVSVQASGPQQVSAAGACAVLSPAAPCGASTALARARSSSKGLQCLMQSSCRLAPLQHPASSRRVSALRSHDQLALRPELISLGLCICCLPLAGYVPASPDQSDFCSQVQMLCPCRSACGLEALLWARSHHRPAPQVRLPHVLKASCRAAMLQHTGHARLYCTQVRASSHHDTCTYQQASTSLLHNLSDWHCMMLWGLHTLRAPLQARS